MEIKKAPKADLEKRKLTYHLVGYAVVLAILFVAFEWSDSEVTKHEITEAEVEIFEEEIINTFMSAPPPPPPPPAPVIDEVIKIVDDDTEIAEAEILDVEDNQAEAQVISAPVTAYGNGPAVEEEPADDMIFVTLEEMPTFPGGDAALMKYLKDNIQYPAVASENNIQGRVFCTFVVNKDGSVVDIEVVRSVDPSLDREAVRVLKNMPKWSPGKQRGKAVRARYSLPVVFRLR